MDNNQSVDEVLIDIAGGGYDPDSNARMSQAELIAELLPQGNEAVENTDPLGEF